MLVMVNLTIAKRRVRNEIKGQWKTPVKSNNNQLHENLLKVLSKVQSQELIVLHATEN